MLKGYWIPSRTFRRPSWLGFIHSTLLVPAYKVTIWSLYETTSPFVGKNHSDTHKKGIMCGITVFCKVWCVFVCDTHLQLCSLYKRLIQEIIFMTNGKILSSYLLLVFKQMIFFPTDLWYGTAIRKRLSNSLTILWGTLVILPMSITWLVSSNYSEVLKTGLVLGKKWIY